MYAQGTQSIICHQGPVTTFTTLVEFFHWVTTVPSYQAPWLPRKWCVTLWAPWMVTSGATFVFYGWVPASKLLSQERRGEKYFIHAAQPTQFLEFYEQSSKKVLFLPFGIAEIKVCKWVPTQLMACNYPLHNIIFDCICILLSQPSQLHNHYNSGRKETRWGGTKAVKSACVGSDPALSLALLGSYISRGQRMEIDCLVMGCWESSDLIPAKYCVLNSTALTVIATRISANNHQKV